MVLFPTIILTLSAAAAIPSAAQLPEDSGPWPAGWQDVTFTDSNYGQGSVHARIHYPALSAGQNTSAANNSGPFPMVALMHGYLGSADGLDMLGNHMASHGYLVASIDTHSGLFPDTMDYAWNIRAMLQWAEDESNTVGSWLENMARPGDWAAVGHSMGGGTLSLLIGIEPRVRAIVGMQAADADSPGETNMNNFTGAGMWIAGSVDNIVPPATVRRWYQRATSAARRSYFLVTGMGHVGPTDNPGNGQPMPGSEQQAVHRRLITPFLDAELRGDDSAYEFIYGSSVDAPWTVEQSSPQPILWGGHEATSTSAEFAIHGMPFSNAVFAWSTALGSTVTPFGLADLDLVAGGQTPVIGLGPLGWGRGDYPFPPMSSGTTFYFQAASFQGANGALTQSLSVTVP
jgi:predicted dienelactone hydrolase